MTWVLVVWFVLELELRMPSHRFYEISFPEWLPINAVALGRHILIGRGLCTTERMGHERAHVDQWRRYTIPGFLLLYSLYQLIYGYSMNPLEIEARALGRLVSTR